MTLRRYERRVYSQNGEDGIIEEIFRRIGTDSRYAVEFGVGDGRQCLTRYLAELGWEVLQLDAFEGAPPVVREHITAENVNQVFAKHGVPANLDLLGVDIDGNDFWVWRALAAHFQPRLVVIEYNASVPWHEAKTVAYEPDLRWDGSTYFGASLLALNRLAAHRGYHLVYCDDRGTNAFFVRADLTGPHLPALTTGEAWRPPSYGWHDGGHPPTTRPMVDVGDDLG